jgi:hypothetical protein
MQIENAEIRRYLMVFCFQQTVGFLEKQEKQNCLNGKSDRGASTSELFCVRPNLKYPRFGCWLRLAPSSYLSSVEAMGAPDGSHDRARGRHERDVEHQATTNRAEQSVRPARQAVAIVRGHDLLIVGDAISEYLRYLNAMSWCPAQF